MITKEDLEQFFITAEKFYVMVNTLVWKNGLTYMEAIMEVCDEKGIDPEDLIRLKLVSPLLKTKLREEAEKAGTIKSSAKLPI